MLLNIGSQDFCLPSWIISTTLLIAKVCLLIIKRMLMLRTSRYETNTTPKVLIEIIKMTQALIDTWQGTV